MAHSLRELPHIVGRNGQEVEDDVRGAWRRYAILYYETLRTLELPAREDVAEFERVARRRLHQSMALADLHAAFRSGARILFEQALTLVDPIDAGMVASLTLEFEDLMATAAERAYLEEQRSFAATQNDYNVGLLLRLLRGEAKADDLDVSGAPIQGYDFARTFSVVSIATSNASQRRFSGADTLPELAQSLRSVLPFALQVQLEPDILLLLVPGDAVSSLAKLLTRVLTSSGSQSFKAGISAPTAGLAGVVPSAGFATRARLVGEILEPDVVVHTWERIRLIDVFKGTEEVAAYVQEHLGPLMENDQRKGTQLVETLAAFLQANGNRKTAARNLTVHINTLDYRLRQIRGILGEDTLGDGSFTAHLAIRLLPLYTQDRPEERQLAQAAQSGSSAPAETTETNAAAV